jgi:transmembrane sensor
MSMDDELIYRSVTSQTSAQEEERLTAWQAASPANAARFRDVVDVLRLCSAADDALRFGPVPGSDDLLSLNIESSAAASGRSGAWRALLLAAAVVATVAIGIPMSQRLQNPAIVAPFGTTFGSAEFVTEMEPGTVGLRDGSVVRLARESRLRVHDRHDAREVSLVGRGYFAVTHDDGAPFTIRSDAGTVTVIGTRFDLTVTGEDLRLIVIEGRVRLTIRGFDVDVHAGQMAQVMKGNLVPPIDVPDPESLIGWVGNFVAFQSTPLRSVAREIENRHGVRMVFSDPALGDRTVTAFFAGRSFDEIAEVICVVTQLQCQRTDNILTMSAGH